MALTPQEQLELEQLEKKYGGQTSGGLTPEESQELAMLESKYGQTQGMKPGLMEEAQRKLDAGEIQEQPKYSLGESVLQSIGDIASFGTLPQIQAGVEQFLTPKAGQVGFAGTNLQGETPEETQLKIQALSPSELIALQSNLTSAQVDELLRQKGIDTKRPSYEQSKQEFSKMQSEMESEYPLETGAAKIATSAAMMPVTAPLFLKPVRSLVTGAVMGGVQDVDEKEDLTDEIKQRIANAAISSGLSVLPDAAKPALSFAKNQIKKVIPSNFIRKVVSTTTGVPEQQISTYYNNVNEVNRIIKQSKGFEESLTDDLKQSIATSLKNTRLKMNNAISDALEQASPEKNIPTSGFIRSLSDFRSKLDPRVEDDAIKSIDEIIGVVGSFGDNVNIGELNKLKEYFRKNTKFQKESKGQIFLNPEASQRAAKKTYLDAKNMLDEVAPQIKQANNVLAKIHGLEDTMNKSLIIPGKPGGDILAAGAGVNKRNEKALKMIGKITGTNPIEDARKISSARAFSQTSIIPEGQTGKTLTRLAVGAGIGGISSTIFGGDEKTGAIVGAALSSPFALKQAIQTMNLTKASIRSSLKALKDPKVKSALTTQYNVNNKDRKRAINLLERELRKPENNND